MPDMDSPENPIQAATPTNLIDQHVAVESSRTECCLEHLWWAGASTMAAACGRSLWTRLMGPNGPRLFPNLYIILVSEPGQGKTLAVRTAAARFAEMKIHTAADSITASKLLSWTAVASEKRIEEGRDPGLVMALENLESLFSRKADSSLKAFLAAAYDCKDEYTQDTQIRGKEPIKNLCLNLIAAATPSHLASCFQASDWAEGLASRFLLILGTPSRIGELPPFDPVMAAALGTAIQDFRNGLGKGVEVGWTPEAWASRLSWRRSQGKTLPPHPHASGYWHGRHILLAKLAMLQAVAAKEDSISSTAWDGALAALATMELGLPTALASTGGNPFAGILASVIRWAFAEGRVLDEWEIRARLADFISPQYVQAAMDGMLAARQLVEVVGAAGPAASPHRRLIHPQLKAPGAKIWEIAKVRAGGAGGAAR